EVGETQEQVIESDDMKAVLDNNFPRVIRYEWKEDGSILEGESEQLYIMEINNDKYIPKVTCNTQNNKTTYTLSIEEIGVEVTLDMLVNNNKLRMEVTNIKESGNTKVKTINFPKHSLASVKSSENGKTASVLTTGDWNNIIEEFKDVKDLGESSKGKTYAFINNDEFAVTINNNVIEGGNRAVLSTSSRDGYKQTGIGNGTWTYREELKMPEGHKPEEELPWSEVMIAKDTNKDDIVDWQDAAIHYRKNMIVPKGGEDIKNQLSHIDFNIGYTQNPFLRSLDTIKKISNYTDNFGQLVLHKGYQAEGHDDSHPDYGGHIGIRQGGVKDFNTLINEGKKYNANIGVHINATEYAKDAFEVKPELINENAPGWAWLDKTFYTDQRKDITSGELFRRLDMLKKDAPDLGWVYVDVYTGNGWNAHKLAEKIDELDYTFATEMNGPLEQDVVWTHWGGDPAYPNKGNASKIMRFIKNDTHDTFLADPLIKGNKHLLSGGWGSRHDIEGEFGIEVFYNQVLPTKYLQHFPIVKMSDKEVLFENGVRSADEGENINYYRDDRLVATTPKKSIGDTGIGDTQLFLPWNPVEEDEKIYHWNPLSTSSTWELPDSWKNLGTVQLYELDDLGKTFVKEVKVEEGKVKLDVEKDTPYLVMKGKVKEERINDWGYGAQIKDPGFDSQTWKNWEKDSDAKDTKHIQIINEKTNGRNGNDLVKISGNNGADAEISQEIKGLEKGATYSVSAWVKNEGNRKIELEVESDDVEVKTKMDEVFYQRNGEGVKFRNDKFTRIEVEFTAQDDEAEISLEVGKGNKDSEVFVDDFRIWKHPGHTNKDGYVFYEDFENVDEGITPFFLAEGRGNSNRTHLAEKNIFGSQYKHWTLDGRFSLKSNQQPDEQGQMFVTEDSTFKLKPNKTYELGFLYSLADAKPGYTFNIKSKSQGTLLSIDLDSTNVNGGDLTNAKEVSQKFTTGNTDDYYISVDKKEHTGDIVQLIIDNIYVKEVNESIKNPQLKYVNLNTMVNELSVGQQVEFDINALMNNGDAVDLSKAKVEYKVSNPKSLEIKDGKMIAKSKGKSNVFVKVKLGNKVVMSNHVTINVK
ncbi:MAG: endo-alpha-N-acetylgalactosaminidase family protein, partial [Peptostreptococcaceae bacterium]